MMNCVHGKYGQVALDHLKDQILTTFTNEFKKHNKSVSNATDTSDIISLLKSHTDIIESEVHILKG